MTSSKPYVLRALYQWIVDNQVTPHILVDAGYEGAQLPVEYVDDNNQILLNISPMACEALVLGDVNIEFSARFSGQAMNILVPTASVLAIYARENGQGMVFGEEPSASHDESEVYDDEPLLDVSDNDLPESPNSPSDKPSGKKRSHLTLVK